MRRLLSTALMLVLALPLFASLLGQTAETRLPVCCRRAGAHHCMEMAEAGAVTLKTTLHATCPMLPRGGATAITGSWSVAARASAVEQAHPRPDVVAQAEAGHRLAASRAWQKRGPPAQNS